MIKIFITVIPAMILFFVSPFTGPVGELNITSSYPAVVKPGEEFTVTVKIHKGGINGIGKLQQYLPPGFTASALQSAGADFAFEDQSVKFLWSSLPLEEDFIVSYKLITETSVSGLQIINGLFVYMEEDKTKRTAVPPIEIKADQNFIGNDNTKKPVVSRKLINVNPAKGEYKVELTVKTNEVKEWARFTDNIPLNFTAELLHAHQGDFNFTDNRVIFKWEKLPDEPEFIVSYLVRSGFEGPPPVIHGVLVFGRENEKYSSDQEKQTENEFVSDNGINDIQRNYTQPEGGESEQNDNQNTNPAMEVSTSPATSAAVSTPAQESKQTNNTEATVQPTKSGINKGLSKIGNMLFKVQISATRRSSVKSSNWFNSRYQINTDVELTYQEGWKKYLIGSFSGYNEAKSYSYKTREKIPDAFVVAYENGVILSVRDALKRQSINQ